MKIKKIGAILKKRETLKLLEKELIDGSVEQYLSDGAVIFPVENLPRFNTETFLEIFEIPKSKRKTWKINTSAVPAGICLDDVTAAKYDAFEYPVTICYQGMSLSMFQILNKVLFVDNFYMQAFKDINDICFEARKDGNGNFFIVVKSGMYFKGAIWPIQTPQVELGNILSSAAEEIYENASKKENKDA